jgi:hypothetical protein
MLKRLGNPFLLVVQGFAAGAVLFFATSDASSARFEAIVRVLIS